MTESVMLLGLKVKERLRNSPPARDSFICSTLRVSTDDVLSSLNPSG